MAFLHGVETIEVQTGSRPITAVKTAVVGLVGTAPVWATATASDATVNRPVLITSPADAARYFGPHVSGYTIPAALKAIFDQGTGLVIAVNVFDPATDKVAAQSAVTFDAKGVVTLPRGYTNLVLKAADDSVVYQPGVDYRAPTRAMAAAGTVQRLAGGAIPLDVAITATYDRPDLTKVTTADVLGATGADGTRTGLQALLTAASRFGFGPRILVAPGFSTQATVAAELEVLAAHLRAVALVDLPLGTTVANAIGGRSGAAGGAANAGSASDRVVLCYPHVRVDDGTGARLEPYSQRLAGAIAARDLERGYHWSPSNTPIRGIVGLERSLTAGISDPSSEVNLLNEAGIVTLFHAYGTGIRSWGNRSAAFPSSTDPRNFIGVRRTADVVHESVEQAMLAFLDQPISDALVDAITESVNAFLRTLIARGALIDGRCSYDPANNPPAEIAAGRLRFDISFMPPAPAERISFDSVIDVNALAAIAGGGGGGVGGDE